MNSVELYLFYVCYRPSLSSYKTKNLSNVYFELSEKELNYKLCFYIVFNTVRFEKWPVDLHSNWKLSRFLLVAAFESITCTLGKIGDNLMSFTPLILFYSYYVHYYSYLKQFREVIDIYM
jgi:hypothetical protein